MSQPFLRRTWPRVCEQEPRSAGLVLLPRPLPSALQTLAGNAPWGPQLCITRARVRHLEFIEHVHTYQCLILGKSRRI